MNKFWNILVFIIFAYQVSFLSSYFSERLVDINHTVADIYWISAGLLGISIGGYVIFKVELGRFSLILSFMVSIFGIGLISLYFLALGITSM